MQGIEFGPDHKVRLPARFNVAVPFIDRHVGEGRGAKAAILLEPESDITRCVKSFVDSLLDLITDDPATRKAIVDRFGTRELIYLGPDENITPAHIDHIGGAAKLKALTGAPVMMNANDEPLYDQMDQQAAWLRVKTPTRTDIDTKLRDGDTLRLGDCDFHAIHTPGHTQGSTSLWIPSHNTLVAGDTLFRDSIGRTDLPGGDTRQILESIDRKSTRLNSSHT